MYEAVLGESRLAGLLLGRSSSLLLLMILDEALVPNSANLRFEGEKRPVGTDGLLSWISPISMSSLLLLSSSNGSFV